MGRFRIRLEWGREGLEALAPYCGAVIIVDVLSFSTSVDIAVGRGGRVLPLPLRRTDPEAARAAARSGAVLAAAKGEGGWSLSPSSLRDLPAGTLLALPSPNGATLSARAADLGAAVLAGSLRNATAVAKAAAEAAGERPIGVIPAGERWGITEGPMRPGIEDYLGAGAIAAALSDRYDDVSPETRLAALAFRAARAQVPALLEQAVSGRELIDSGLGADVALAAQVDVSAAAPRLADGIYAA
ncbi:2-phosphosulfolactate phosphatase [Nocardia sp. CDC159]|uniref:Probable 2-phosphosulfolactate phosphatase n=1 Tax=Nocardia pulmonis TaxID=2951408 RepID=A0A9X2IUG1_9NOCA|nr:MULTISPECIES: 2-phosphosulfolactate phosphatase [Nocardia]MCM6772043.1 2-phosphosulfolactate phosphatase [Nocardia pulmonis]MCM6785299.1 2-phosphosulfolactate phosphatase [Nocardia sp. CDC159]